VIEACDVSELSTEKAVEELRVRFGEEELASQMSLVKAYCLLEIIAKRNTHAMSVY
jgi:hypothetical protein